MVPKTNLEAINELYNQHIAKLEDGDVIKFMDKMQGLARQARVNVEKSATDFYWKDSTKLSDNISKYQIAFLGSDKIKNMDETPGNILLPMILRYEQLTGKKPYHLSLYLGQQPWSPEANKEMIDALVASKKPIMLFHPCLKKGSPTGNEFEWLIDAEKVKCYYYSFNSNGFQEIDKKKKNDILNKTGKKILAPFLFCFCEGGPGEVEYSSEMALYYCDLLKNFNSEVNLYKIREL